MAKSQGIKNLPFLALVIGFLLFIPFTYYFIAREVQSDQQSPQNPQLFPEPLIYPQSVYSNSRVAVIIPYVGSTLPPWFRTFLFTAQFSSEYFDWFIFVTSVKNISTPSNVFLIYVDEKEMANKIVRMDPSRDPSEYAFWSNKFLDLLHLFPYMLVEFKPALGWIFERYITKYSHWAFADLDMLLGRVSSFLSEDILQKYDVYTSSFSDSNRMYMRGQLTIFRNHPFMNQLWKQCPHFPTITTRMEHFFQSEPNLNARTKGWKFQSAEGCISKIVTDQRNLTIYVAATQISDAFHAPLSEKESIIIGSSLMRCYKSPIRISSFATRDLKSRYIDNLSHQIVPLQSMENPTCEYWVDPKYQVCLSDSQLTKELDITWRGPLHVTGQHVSYDISSPAEEDEGTCREGMISHFQGWKDAYYAFTTRPPSLDTHSLLLTQTGIIPLRLKPTPTASSLPTIKEILTLHHKEMRTSPVPQKKIFFGDECNGLYCRQYNSNLKSCVSYISCEDITYFRTGNSPDPTKKLTLIVVGNEDSISSGAIDQTLNSWHGEKVIVIQSSSSTSSLSSESMEFISRVTHTSFHLKSFHDRVPKDFQSSHTLNQNSPCVTVIFVATDSSFPSAPLLDKTLFNIGMDLSPTDSVLLTSPGYVFPHQLESYLEMNLNSSPHSAILIPSFLSDQVGKLYHMSDGNLKKLCGFENQPNSLHLKSSHLEQIKQSKDLLPISLNSTDKPSSYFGYQSSLIPVAFNTRSCLHGDSFVRFPMELNGKYCYGTALYSILEGAGYRLNWSAMVATIDRTYLQRRRPKTQCEACSLDAPDYERFVKAVKR